jgi:hypothetical protein
VAVVPDAGKKITLREIAAPRDRAKPLKTARFQLDRLLLKARHATHSPP